MQKYFNLVVMLCLSVTMQAQETNQVESKLLKELITQKAALGVAAGYTINGKLEWQGAEGYTNKKTKNKFELNTVVRIASIAKSMTALAVMQLLEKGLIDLDAPIQTYIPDFPKQANTQITTRHLLSHTSGLSAYKNGKEAQTKTNYANLTAALNIFKHRPLKFEAGTQYAYTTYGYTVLGVIVERVSGLSFEEYMQTNIWDKAGMTNTGVEKYGIVLANESSLYHRKRNGKIKKGKENNLSNRIPGGGVYSTVEDLLKFGNAVLKHTFVKEETLDLMRQHHSLEKERNAYGFGWFLYNPKPDEGAIIGHTGEQTGCSAQLFIVPASNIVVITLANTSGALRDVSIFSGELMGLALEK